MSGTWIVENLTPQATYELRRLVLRPHETVAQQALDDDGAPETAHVGVHIGAKIVATGSIRRSTLPWASGHGPDASCESTGWRIRGMATAQRYRGQGLGTAVIASLLAHAAGHGGGVVWCNARIRATSLYHRSGFQPLGDVFELADIGPHQLMWRRVEPA